MSSTISVSADCQVECATPTSKEKNNANGSEKAFSKVFALCSDNSTSKSKKTESTNLPQNEEQISNDESSDEDIPIFAQSVFTIEFLEKANNNRTEGLKLNSENEKIEIIPEAFGKPLLPYSKSLSESSPISLLLNRNVKNTNLNKTQNETVKSHDKLASIKEMSGEYPPEQDIPDLLIDKQSKSTKSGMNIISENDESNRVNLNIPNSKNIKNATETKVSTLEFTAASQNGFKIKQNNYVRNNGSGEILDFALKQSSESKSEATIKHFRLIKSESQIQNSKLDNTHSASLKRVNQLKNTKTADSENETAFFQEVSKYENAKIKISNGVKSTETATVAQLTTNPQKNDINLKQSEKSKFEQKTGSVFKSEHNIQQNAENQTGSFGENIFNNENQTKNQTHDTLKAELKAQSFQYNHKGETITPNQDSAQTYNFGTFKEIPLKEFNSNVVQMVRNMADNSTGTARITLKPEQLGTVFVELNIINQKVNMNIRADRPETAKLIESQIVSLRDKLGNAGVEAEKIEIKYKEQEPFSYNKQNNQNGSQNRKDEQDTRRAFVNTFRAAPSYAREQEVFSITEN